jgi:hypothetical protein
MSSQDSISDQSDDEDHTNADQDVDLHQNNTGTGADSEPAGLASGPNAGFGAYSSLLMNLAYQIGPEALSRFNFSELLEEFGIASNDAIMITQNLHDAGFLLADSDSKSESDMSHDDHEDDHEDDDHHDEDAAAESKLDAKVVDHDDTVLSYELRFDIVDQRRIPPGPSLVSWVCLLCVCVCVCMCVSMCVCVCVCVCV